MKIFGMGASLRTGSYNHKFIVQVSELLKTHPGVSFELGELKDFDIPLYNGDMEESSGVPEGAQKLAARIAAADAVIFSAPEYNGSISGVFKNTIDWLSRLDENPLDGKQILLIGASPGALGAVRGLWHTRVPLEALGAFVYPEMMGLPKAAQAFKDDGTFADPKTQGRLAELLKSFVEYASRKATL